MISMTTAYELMQGDYPTGVPDIKCGRLELLDDTLPKSMSVSKLPLSGTAPIWLRNGFYSMFGLSGGVYWDYEIHLTTLDTETHVPEPSTMLLFGVGLAGLAGVQVKRKQKS